MTGWTERLILAAAVLYLLMFLTATAALGDVLPTGSCNGITLWSTVVDSMNVLAGLAAFGALLFSWRDRQIRDEPNLMMLDGTFAVGLSRNADVTGGSASLTNLGSGPAVGVILTVSAVECLIQAEGLIVEFDRPPSYLPAKVLNPLPRDFKPNTNTLRIRAISPNGRVSISDAMGTLLWELFAGALAEYHKHLKQAQESTQWSYVRANFRFALRVDCTNRVGKRFWWAEPDVVVIGECKSAYDYDNGLPEDEPIVTSLIAGRVHFSNYGDGGAREQFASSRSK